MSCEGEQDDTRGFTEAPLCAVANVLIDRTSGDEKSVLHGTLHFAPAAKVYAVSFRWQHDGTRAEVIGRHRKRNQFICVIMHVKHLTNWRVQRVYQPNVACEIRKQGERTEEQLRGILDQVRKEGIQSQPFAERQRKTSRDKYRSPVPPS